MSQLAGPTRCPACNPIHGSGMVRSGKSARRGCALCGDTERVTVEVARGYLQHLQTGHDATGSSWNVRSTMPAEYVKRRGRE